MLVDMVGANEHQGVDPSCHHRTNAPSPELLEYSRQCIILPITEPIN
jgi:hypothetical protein